MWGLGERLLLPKPGAKKAEDAEPLSITGRCTFRKSTGDPGASDPGDPRAGDPGAGDPGDGAGQKVSSAKPAYVVQVVQTGGCSKCGDIDGEYINRPT